ncbi:hypothetical protein Nit79A3_3292 [Nitrosomonas sp. Is79A3]
MNIACEEKAFICLTTFIRFNVASKGFLTEQNKFNLKEEGSLCLKQNNLERLLAQ